MELLFQEAPYTWCKLNPTFVDKTDLAALSSLDPARFFKINFPSREYASWSNLVGKSA